MYNFIFYFCFLGTWILEPIMQFVEIDSETIDVGFVTMLFILGGNSVSSVLLFYYFICMDRLYPIYEEVL